MRFISIKLNVGPQLSAWIKDIDGIEKQLSEINDDHSKLKTILKLNRIHYL